MGIAGKLALAAVCVLAPLTGCGGDATTAVSTIPEGSSPQEIFESANFGAVHSGELGLWLSFDRNRPHRTEGVKMRILGPFAGVGEGGLPQFDLAIESKGSLAGLDTESLGGLLLNPEYAVASYEGQTYEPDKETFEDLKSKLEEAQEQGDDGNAMACFEAAAGLELKSLVHHFRNEGRSKEFYETPVTLVGGDVDVSGVIEALIELMEDPTCGAQLKAVGVPPVSLLKAITTVVSSYEFEETKTRLAIDKHGLVHELEVKVTGKNVAGEPFLVGVSIFGLAI